MNRNDGRRLRLSFNAPVTLAFVALCVAVRLLSTLTGGASDKAVFSVYRAPLLDPLTWVRCVGHVFGHANWSHLFSNMMYILLLGPMIEEKYGSGNIVLVILVTAVVTGVIHMLVSPGTMLLGASGVVFAFILISSITVREDRTIPVTFILVAVLYLGQQVYEGLFTQDNVSQLTHIAGGAVGSVMGFLLNAAGKKDRSRYGAALFIQSGYRLRRILRRSSAAAYSSFSSFVSGVKAGMGTGLSSSSSATKTT